eukprot:gnl/Chilomastix_cuspidata/1616.p1 GENE.gnl/Chilomastix_cuspidata/1616~~gnl/Chilomastix_cuspidata/1616.p1  ORF type:complete len:718 (-),score=303.05 gnl/Chilomastix_cuspidata/1616:1495-3648(-)
MEDVRLFLAPYFRVFPTLQSDTEPAAISLFVYEGGKRTELMTVQKKGKKFRFQRDAVIKVMDFSELKSAIDSCIGTIFNVKRVSLSREGRIGISQQTLRLCRDVIGRVHSAIGAAAAPEYAPARDGSSARITLEKRPDTPRVQLTVAPRRVTLAAGKRTLLDAAPAQFLDALAPVLASLRARLLFPEAFEVTSRLTADLKEDLEFVIQDTDTHWKFFFADAASSAPLFTVRVPRAAPAGATFAKGGEERHVPLLLAIRTALSELFGFPLVPPKDERPSFLGAAAQTAEVPLSPGSPRAGGAEGAADGGTSFYTKKNTVRPLLKELVRVAEKHFAEVTARVVYKPSFVQFRVICDGARLPLVVLLLDASYVLFAYNVLEFKNSDFAEFTAWLDAYLLNFAKAVKFEGLTERFLARCTAAGVAVTAQKRNTKRLWRMVFSSQKKSRASLSVPRLDAARCRLHFIDTHPDERQVFLTLAEDAPEVFGDELEILHDGDEASGALPAQEEAAPAAPADPLDEVSGAIMAAYGEGAGAPFAFPSSDELIGIFSGRISERVHELRVKVAEKEASVASSEERGEHTAMRVRGLMRAIWEAVAQHLDERAAAISRVSEKLQLPLRLRENWESEFGALFGATVRALASRVGLLELVELFGESDWSEAISPVVLDCTAAFLAAALQLHRLTPSPVEDEAAPDAPLVPCWSTASGFEVIAAIPTNPARH